MLKNHPNNQNCERKHKPQHVTVITITRTLNLVATLLSKIILNTKLHREPLLLSSAILRTLLQIRINKYNIYKSEKYSFYSVNCFAL